jgi:Arc/MetJ family transcription regulator
MQTKKVSLTLDKDLLAEAREMAGSQKLSGYVNRALRLQLQHDRLADLGAHILTGDQEDLERLAAAHPEVWIQPL